MNDTLLDQADSLMRRRSFIAGAKPAEAQANEPIATDTPLHRREAGESRESGGSPEFDVPVLTDIVESATDTSPAHSTTVTPITDTELEARLLAQQAEFRETLEVWLEETLPKAIAGALDGIGDYLVSELRDRARAELLPATTQSTNGEETLARDSREALNNERP